MDFNDYHPAPVAPLASDVPAPVMPATGSMDALQISRRLQRIAVSVESFLLNHTDRLAGTVKAVSESEARARATIEALESFSAEKAAWEQERRAEIERLNLASEKLIEGWQELEAERKKLLTQRSQPAVQVSSQQPQPGFAGLMPQQPVIASGSGEGPGLDRLELLRREIQRHAGNG